MSHHKLTLAADYLAAVAHCAQLGPIVVGDQHPIVKPDPPQAGTSDD